MAIGRQRDIDDAGADLGCVLRRKAKRRDGCRTIALRKNIGLRQQAAQHVPPLLALEIDKAGQLAAPGVDGEPGDRRQVRTGNQHHVGAVHRQRAAGDGACDHPRQIEHAHARKRPIAGRPRFRRGFADFLDRDQRQFGQRFRVRRAPTIRHASASARPRSRRHRPRSRTPRRPIAAVRPAPRRAPACSSAPCRRRRDDAENWCAAARSGRSPVL